MKLIGNSLILGAIEVMAESLTLGEKAGIDTELTVSLIKGKLIYSCFVQVYFSYSSSFRRPIPEHTVSAR